MSRLGGFAAIVLPLFALGACGKQPCNEDETGPTVRLDVAFGECNFAPVGSIDAPTLTVKGGPTILDGSKSFDLNVEDNLRFTWTMVEKPETSTAELLTPNEVQASFVADAQGAYEIQLVVSDGTRSSEPVSVRIRNENVRPIANAGANQMVDFGVTVTLDGSNSSDEDGDTLSYLWSLADAPSQSAARLDDVSAVRPVFVPDVRGIYQFSLVVNDGTVDSETAATVDVNVGVSANPPVAVAGRDRTVELGQMVVLDANGSSDQDGDALVYRWSLVEKPETSAAALLNTDQVLSGFTADQVGEYVVALLVDDGFFRANAVVRFTVDPVPHDGVFDPDSVYLSGATKDGLGVCSLDGTTIAVQMPSGQKRIRRTDGAIVYWSNMRLYQYVPDTPFYTPDGQIIYDPPDPLSNDIELDTSGCPNGVEENGWRLHSGNGTLYYQCGAQVMTVTGTVSLCFNMTPLAFGADGTALCAIAVHDATGTRHFHHLADGSFLTSNFYAARSRPGGGYWALYRSDSTFRRWGIDPSSGRAEVELSYAPLPEGYVVVGDPAFEPSGALLRLAREKRADSYIITRSEGPTDSTIIFSDNEVCSSVVGSLATGI